MKTLISVLVFAVSLLGQAAAQTFQFSTHTPTAEEKWLEEGKKFHPGMQMKVEWFGPSQSTGFIESHMALTPTEALRWKRMVARVNTVLAESDALEKRLIAAHHLIENHECGEHIAIRSYEAFIFDSVPDNPEWNGVKCGKALREKRELAKFYADGRLAEK